MGTKQWRGTLRGVDSGAFVLSVCFSTAGHSAFCSHCRRCWRHNGKASNRALLLSFGARIIITTDDKKCGRENADPPMGRSRRERTKFNDAHGDVRCATESRHSSTSKSSGLLSLFFTYYSPERKKNVALRLARKTIR